MTGPLRLLSAPLVAWVTTATTVGTVALYVLHVNFWVRGGLALLVAVAWRVAPIPRPESVMLNVLLGWLLGEFINLLVWR